MLRGPSSGNMPSWATKMESEIANRASSLKSAEAACVARAFALNIATPTTVISPLPDMLVSFVNVQVEPLGLAEWAAFQDALRTRPLLDVKLAMML